MVLGGGAVSCEKGTPVHPPQLWGERVPGLSKLVQPNRLETVFAARVSGEFEFLLQNGITTLYAR